MKLRLQHSEKISELTILTITIFLIAVPITLAQNNTTTLYFFWGSGCPHCAQMKPFLEKLEEKYPSLEVKKFEVYFNQSNRELFEKVAKAYNTEFQGVPTVFIDEKVIIGYNKEIAQKLEETINECVEGGCISPEDILKGKSKSISIEKGNFSEYEKTQEGLTIFIIMILLFVALLFSIILIKRKRGVKK